MNANQESRESLESEIEGLHRQLREADETIEAIRSGAVDAVVVKCPDGRSASQSIYTRDGADRPYRILVERMQQGAVTLSKDCTIVYCNPRFAELIGEPAETVIGRTLPGFFLAIQRPLLAELFQRALQGTAGGEFILQTQSRGFKPVLLALNELPPESGVAVGVLVTDLTEQKVHGQLAEAVESLRQSDAKFRQLADSMPQLVWMAQPDGNIDWYNRRWYEYTGSTPEAMSGWGWQSVHDPNVLSDVLQKWKDCIATEEPFEMTFPLRGADGVFRPFLTRITPVLDSDGRVVRWFGTNTDISAERDTQEQLRDIAAKLSEADRRKDVFLATLAHELRNPLSPIKTASQLMIGVVDDIDELRELGGVIDRQVVQMVRLIDDLLDVSRISRGKVKLQIADCDLKDVIRSAIEAATPFISESSQTLHVEVSDEPLLVHGDCARLVQVVVNLLNNAGKYTPAEGEIWLTARSDGDETLIQVRDNGIGLDQQHLTTVFEMFEQVDAAEERGQSGLGIGLSLVKSLIDLHRGSVRAESDGEGLGSTFSVRIPRAAEPIDSECRPADTELTAGPTRRFRVLVVEDTRPIRMMLVRLLQKMGHEVIEAENGQRGLELAEQSLPEVVLSDISMPIMNGHEMAKKLRGQNRFAKLYLVALTGYGQEADRADALASGFDTHIVKPVDMAVLNKLFADLSANIAG